LYRIAPAVAAVHASLPVPATLIGPRISTFMPVAGLVVPMPTLPLLAIVIAVISPVEFELFVLFVLNTIWLFDAVAAPVESK
jgi:hypothetical protein